MGQLADYWPEPASGLREFRNFEVHYTKHVLDQNEWGVPISRGDYAQAADNFVERAPRNPRLQWLVESNSRVSIYDAQTGEFATLAGDGDIVTYFLTDEEGRYYTDNLKTLLSAGVVVEWGGPGT